MESGEFLARIKLALEGQQSVVGGLKDTQAAVDKLSKTKVTIFTDKTGLVTGAKIQETLGEINKETTKGAGVMEQFGMAMKRALIVAPVWMILRNAMMAVTNTVQEQVKFLIDLETAMTRIKIVGKGTEEEYKTLRTALVGLAYTYGTTASEAADAAVLFAQQGRSVKETIELTRAAMLASKILGTDLKTAVDDMTAAVEGFKLGIGDATTIVDRWINVEKQFAVTSKDLADATKVAGASANQLGISMSEFLGDVTAAVEVTRKTGSEVARGLSFIYARLLTSGKDTVEQIAKIPFYLDSTGKATNEVGNQFRSISDILGDLAGKWEMLTTTEKLEIATALGSKRQMVILNALMQNYTASLDARIASLTSAGSAEKAFQLIQDTTATKLKQVGAAWNVLTTAVGDTTVFRETIGLFDKLILGFATLINYEKGYGAILSRELNQLQLANETRLNQVKSLEELIAVREKLAKAPQTDENIERLKTVTEAINSIGEKEYKIKFAFESGNIEQLKKVINSIIEETSQTKIKLNVRGEFEPKIVGLEKEIKDLQEKFVLPGDPLKWRDKLVKKEEELKKLYEEQNKQIKEQYKIQKGQELTNKLKLETIENESLISSTLTEKEEEQLDIEIKLLELKQSGLFTSEELIRKEIELVNQSKFQYDEHDKLLKIKQLENNANAAALIDSEKLIKQELELLKIRGTNTNQLLEIEAVLKAQLYGQDAVKNSLEYQFNLEKQITKEKLNQVEVSNESIALFKIAQKEGNEAARVIGEFLAGGIDYSQLGNFKDIFKKYFSQRAEEIEAAQYLGIPYRGAKGSVGNPEGRYYGAEGGRIPIPEFPQYNPIDLRAKQTSIKENKVTIDKLEVNLNTELKGKTKEEKATNLLSDIAQEIISSKELTKKIEDQIENF
jgi:TP901 family phage tail tape measure protein